MIVEHYEDLRAAVLGESSTPRMGVDHRSSRGNCPLDLDAA